MKPLDNLPDNHTAALDLICGGDPELLRIRAEAQAHFKERYPGLTEGQHLAMTRTCFEHFWTEGVKAERARVDALVKMLRPETCNLVLGALLDGHTVGDILDPGIEAIQKGAGRLSQSPVHGYSEKVEALSKAVRQRFPALNGAKGQTN